jgi:hypothetical protein
MKPNLLLCSALVLFANSVFASVVNYHVLPRMPPEWNVPVSVKETDVDFGMHFTVFYKHIGVDTDEFVIGQVEVSDVDNQIVSCPVQKTWRTNGVQFECIVSGTYLLASKFQISSEWRQRRSRTRPIERQ